MDKKAQYYLVVVVIICIAIFSFLSITTARPVPKQDNFQKLLENCYKESVFVMNQAVKNNKKIFTEFKKFADDFKAYSKTVDRDFGFIYLATNITGGTRITNMLESDIEVQAVTESSAANITQGSHFTDDTEYVNLTINDIQYDFETTRKPNIQFLFWEEKDDMRRVKQI